MGKIFEHLGKNVYTKFDILKMGRLKQTLIVIKVSKI